MVEWLLQDLIIWRTYLLLLGAMIVFVAATILEPLERRWRCGR